MLLRKLTSFTVKTLNIISNFKKRIAPTILKRCMPELLIPKQDSYQYLLKTTGPLAPYF